MKTFADLLDRLAYEPRRNAKLALLKDYFAHAPDPDRGYALAAMTGSLSFANAKPGLIRQLVLERVDPVLFSLSYDYVGDLSETVALLWRRDASATDTPTLAAAVESFANASKSDAPALIARWLDALDENGRWALLKLITGALRIGVSARLAKTALAELGGVSADDVEHVWHALQPPYLDLFAWIEKRGPRPESRDPAPFRPPMLAHAIEDSDFERLDPAEFRAEWKWDGIRMQVAGGHGTGGRKVTRLYSRTGDEVSRAFPDLMDALHDLDGAIDGELIIMRDGRVQSFNILQQRLNRKTVTAKMLTDYPAHIRAYDLLADGAEDLREKPFLERRARLEAFVAQLNSPRLDLSPLIPFATWDELAKARANPEPAGAGEDAAAVEGCMIKKADSLYMPGRPKGLWWKWKRDPYVVDAVLMYAQRGHGKRSSYYSDYTFGVWRSGEDGDQLTPVGKAYFGFTDEELIEIDRFVRRETINRFGPVREVTHEPDKGLVFEVAFEGIQRSSRHKSGVAMRFPRIARIRWDKPPREADRLETLERLIEAAERAA
ncbi:cisplatin damage response ATP-dependent DNA ligase [Terrarubrum flagellatum]|uniref:cisplatin damage response ATP-dependent DNA ligase n=1 Tax=Terrirubrum flagellatum TaxID=2895980 RepID=UPI00314546A2